MSSPSGAQVRLTHGRQHATVVAVGAGLREYTVDGLDVLLPYEEDVIAPAYDGLLLAPWPNRLRDGRYTVDGVEYQVPMTEPDRRTALHGLVAFERFEVIARGESAVTLAHDLVPTAGYPWPLHLEVTYALADDGLTATVAVSTDGPSAAPVGLGFHPWLAPGPGGLDACALALDAAEHVVVDDRLLPVGRQPSDPALTTGLPLADVALDDAWTGTAHDGTGRTLARLLRSDGRTSTVWGDASVTAWQVCTGDAVPRIARAGVAVEPMTCIADALRTGDDLIWVSAQAPHETRWGLALS